MTDVLARIAARAAALATAAQAFGAAAGPAGERKDARDMALLEQQDGSRKAAMDAKAEGNAAFAAGDYEAAERAFSSSACSSALAILIGGRTYAEGTTAGSRLGQRARWRLASAPDHTSGCPKLRRASASSWAALGRPDWP